MKTPTQCKGFNTLGAATVSVINAIISKDKIILEMFSSARRSTVEGLK